MCEPPTCDPAPVQKSLLPLQYKGESRQPHGQVEGDAAGHDRKVTDVTKPPGNVFLKATDS